ncbi:hypothetical protein [Rummeliibacillus sp. SL167]|uniref:hypothetical protein n=1 Tax=Rummeliibacillus sp. SL167 TaxID=2579792 RepID=UPI0011B37F6D|nr:hypothetical protein [Rummeliibacillus sp. SL167]
MNQNDAYQLCCRYHGQNVRIKCNDGTVHVGEITRVTRNMVWIRPQGGGLGGGYGLGFWGYGPGFGYRPGLGVGIALGAILGIGLASAFFW